MKINEIKAALAQMAQKVEPVAVTSVTPSKTETGAMAPATPAKKPRASKSVTRSTVGETIQQNAPAPVEQNVTPKPVNVNVNAPVPEPSVTTQTEPKPVEPEPKPQPKTRKATTPRKTKAATVVPIDGIEAVVATHLKAGVDYDTIPGCGRKPALLKAGAEKLAEIYGLRTTSRVINRVERYDQLFVLYEVQTTIYDRDGNILAEGFGSSNTKERKYLKSISPQTCTRRWLSPSRGHLSAESFWLPMPRVSSRKTSRISRLRCAKQEPSDNMFKK